jgi:hypothetical protein
MAKWYGSLTNRLAENTKSPKPEVGMGVTFMMYSDRHAGTIVEVLSPKKIMVQFDKAVRTDSNGFSENQSYKFEPQPTSAKILVTLRKDGRWHEGTKLDGTVVVLGRREEHYDFSH